MRPAALALLVLGSLAVPSLGTVCSAWRQSQQRAEHLQHQLALVERLGLTDLALFTEARYTRHPSQADVHSAFQDHPAALEHFPTGALLSPPPSLHPNAPLAGKTTTPD